MERNTHKKYQVLAAATGINFLAGLLYIWSIVGKGLTEQFGWTSKQASLPYTVATITFVLSMAAAGRLQDKRGPGICAILSAILIGSGLILSSLTTDPTLMLLTFGVVTGAGIGLSSIATMPPALKWFPPQKKGLITGIVVGGIAIASVVYSPLMAYLIRQYGVSRSFLVIGIGVFLLMLILAQFLKNPPDGYDPNAQENTDTKTTRNTNKNTVKNAQKNTDANKQISKADAATEVVTDTDWKGMLKRADFYLLWLMLGLSSAAGLMVIGHAAGIAKSQVGWQGGFILVILIAVFNALGRLAGGHISDKIGRIPYLRGVFLLLALNMLAFSFYTSIPLLCIGAAVTGICYGSIFAVFPATTADFFGLQYFGGNYGLVFTAWGFGGFLGPMSAAAIFDTSGNYNAAYFIFSGLLLMALALSFLVKAKGRKERKV